MMLSSRCSVAFRPPPPAGENQQLVALLEDGCEATVGCFPLVGLGEAAVTGRQAAIACLNTGTMRAVRCRGPVGL